MTTTETYALASVIAVSCVSFVGILVVSLSEQRLQRLLFILVSLAAGGLFGDAFLHLLPEAFRRPDPPLLVALSILAGIFTFFVLEKFLRWQHHHFHSAITPLGYMNLVADAIHNLIDGMLIGAAYQISIPVGMTTTLAVILHEIPQEIGDIGVLIHAGFSRTRALLLNFVSASLAIIGTCIALLVGPQVEHFSRVMLPFAAGGFIYIAGSDLLPELHLELQPMKSLFQLLAMSVGVGLMLVFALFE
jgi:zinc and cadmium transporter